MPAAIPHRVNTQVRLDEITWAKTKVIAKKENRSANSQLEYFMKIGVQKWEAENGVIELPKGD